MSTRACQGAEDTPTFICCRRALTIARRRPCAVIIQGRPSPPALCPRAHARPAVAGTQAQHTTMPRYFCDYCDVYLTHDSAPGRKQHIRGWKHRENVKQYYEQYMKQFYEQNSGMGMTMPGMAMGSLGALTAGRAPMGLLGMQRPGVAPPLALMGAPGSIPRPPLGYPRPPLGVPPPMGSIPVRKSDLRRVRPE